MSLILPKSSYARKWRSIPENRKKEQAWARASYRKYKTKYLIKAKEKRERLKRIVFVHYGGNPPKCACCRETEYRFLTVDHIYNDGSKERLKLFGTKTGSGSYQFYLYLKTHKFPKRYQILCSNCNFGKRMNKGVCPHVK